MLSSFSQSPCITLPFTLSLSYTLQCHPTPCSSPYTFLPYLSFSSPSPSLSIQHIFSPCLSLTLHCHPTPRPYCHFSCLILVYRSSLHPISLSLTPYAVTLNPIVTLPDFSVQIFSSPYLSLTPYTVTLHPDLHPVVTLSDFNIQPFPSPYLSLTPYTVTLHPIVTA